MRNARSSFKGKNDYTFHTPSMLMKTSKIARTDDTQSTIIRTLKAKVVASRLVDRSKNININQKNLIIFLKHEDNKLVN
jgi:hypothetical protein